ncbi:erythromycin esterase family protein [Nonomuraea endophytica]|uniref:erythromycin esterase family protein n=1 Tax=Nonomuraea endophytica TaxID=714136 RepID=UPI0037CC09AF
MKIILAGTLALTLVGTPAGADDVVDALDAAAKPLTSDLTPFGRMVGDAKVVGVGEATHSSSEFYTLNKQLFSYLATEKGFTTFAREISWATGVRLNDYVLNGKGDPGAILHAESRGPYDLFDNRELLDLITWMRGHNTTHKEKVQFMGADLLYPGGVLFDQVLAYVKQARPRLLPTFNRLYKGLRPTTPDAGVYMGMALQESLTDRMDKAKRAAKALRLLEGQGSGSEHAWAVQHARALTQTFTGYAFEDQKEAQVYRDKAMADNVAWWNRATGAKIQLSGLNPHISLAPIDPAFVPSPLGGVLRKTFGKRYVSVGTTFDHGGYNFAIEKGNCPNGSKPAERPLTCKGSVESAPGGYNEQVLDQVRFKDFILDTRTALPTARTWLTAARPTRVIGGGFWAPGEDLKVAIGTSYDVLIHLNTVKAAKLLP